MKQGVWMIEGFGKLSIHLGVLSAVIINTRKLWHALVEWRVNDWYLSCGIMETLACHSQQSDMHRVVRIP